MTFVAIIADVKSHGPDAARAIILEDSELSLSALMRLLTPATGAPCVAHKVDMLAQGRVSLGELGSWQVALIREAQAIERERVAHAETEVHVRPNRPAGSLSAFAGGDE